MIATLFSLAAATMGVQANAADTTTAAAVVTATPAPAASKASGKKYCVVDTLTGSRMPRKVCQTRDQWLATGWDPLNP